MADIERTGLEKELLERCGLKMGSRIIEATRRHGNEEYSAMYLQFICLKYMQGGGIIFCPETYVPRIVRNATMYERKRNRAMIGRAVRAFFSRQHRRPTPREEAEDAETKTRLRRLITQLPPLEQEVVRLRFFDGLTINETASLLHVTLAKAYRAQVRALQVLREGLVDGPDGSPALA